LSAKNAEGMKEHRQVVKRSGTPAEHAAPPAPPRGREAVRQIIYRTFGTWLVCDT